jgi:putative membrane protein
MGFIIRVLVNAAALAVATRLVSGVSVTSTGALLVAALVLGIINAVVRPILVILTFPLTLITLGLFLLVLNAVTVWLTSVVVPGFLVASFWPAFFTSLIVSIVSWILTAFLSDAGRFRRL